MTEAATATGVDPEPATRSGPENVMCRLLGVPDGPPTARQRRDDAPYRIFNVAMILSGLRCLLSYVVFPFVTPALGLAAGVGPWIGIPIAVLALSFDFIGIRRFWLADHRLKWQMTVVYLAVMGLVTYLLVGDVVHLA